MTATAINTASIIPFSHDQFGSLRIIKDETTGKPWFVAKDVAEALGYSNTRNAIAAHCKHAKSERVGSASKQGGTPFITIIPEADVYRLIIRSNLPAAEKFEEWVMEEVLPSIRKHGGYLTPSKVEEALLNPDTLIQLAMNLKEERTKRLEAEPIP